jgi:hypothetical protein
LFCSSKREDNLTKLKYFRRLFNVIHILIKYIFYISLNLKGGEILERPWAKPFESREEAMKTLDQMGAMFHVCYWLGIIFAVIGVIGDAANITLGLSSTIWLLLAIISFLALIPMLVTWAVALHLLSMKIKD